MKHLHFDNCEELSSYMFELADSGMYVVAVLFYERAIELTKELLMYDEVNATSLDVSPADWDGYDREYYVSITPEDLSICVEPAFYEKYLMTDADLMLIDADADSAILDTVEDESHCKELYIGSSYDEEDNADKVTISVMFEKTSDDEEQIHISDSVSDFSTVKITFPHTYSEDEVNELVDKFAEIIKGS